MWASLVLDFTRHFKIYELDVIETAATSPLFNNKAINRRLSVDGVRLVFDHLAEKGNAQWLDREKKMVRVIWRTDDEWANIIYKYALDNMMIDTVCTLFELRESDRVEGQEFYMLDLPIFMRALQALERRGQAKVFTGNTKENVGVKFFAKNL